MWLEARCCLWLGGRVFSTFAAESAQSSLFMLLLAALCVAQEWFQVELRHHVSPRRGLRVIRQRSAPGGSDDEIDSLFPRLSEPRIPRTLP